MAGKTASKPIGARKRKPAAKTIVKPEDESDFPAFAKRNLRIRSKDGAIIPLKLNAVQRLVHARLEAQRAETGRVRALILKARQPGVSTYVEARYYWQVTRRAGVRAYILTHLRDATDAIFEMVDRFHDRNPDEDKPHIGASNAKELYFDRLDSGYRVGTAGSRAVGRGHTIQFFHGSEVAHWPNAGAFPAAAHEQALDRLTMLVQQHSEELARSLRYPVSDSTSITGEIPNSADRASKFLGFDSGSNPIASAGSVDGLAVSAFVATLIDDVDAAAFLTTLGVSTFIQTLLDAADAATARATLAALAEVDVSGAAREYTATQNFNETTLADGATIDWDASANQVASVTLAGNRTMAAPTNLVAGATYILRVVQDGTGSRTLTWNSVFKWSGGTAPTLSTGADAIDLISFYSDGTNLYGVAQTDFS